MSYFPLVQHIDNQIPKIQRISPIGGALVEQTTRLVGANFGSAIDTNFWTAANNGAASASGVASGIATLVSGTANNGYGNITSTRKARFLFANPNMYRGAIRVTAANVANCTRRFGAFTPAANPYNTPTNGFGFEISATGVLSCKTWSNGSVANAVNSGSFNGQVTAYTIDTNVHAYEIIYFVMEVWFFVDGVLLHKFTPTTAVLTQDLVLPITTTIFNSAGGTTSGTMEFWASSILRFGKELTRPRSARISTNATTVLKIGAGTIHSVVLNNSPTVNHTLTIYDNTAASGTILNVFTASASQIPFEITFSPLGLDFYTGLTLVTATGATPGDWLVIYD